MGLHVTAEQFALVTEKTWALSRWERGKPKPTTIAAQRQALQCAAGPGHRKAILRRWRSSKRAFFEYRKERLADWCAPHPHPEGDNCWVIPAWCVYAESGGSWSADNPESDARGPYQELGHGGPWPVTTRAEAMEHHRIAEALYRAGGLEPWVACS